MQIHKRNILIVAWRETPKKHRKTTVTVDDYWTPSIKPLHFQLPAVLNMFVDAFQTQVVILTEYVKVQMHKLMLVISLSKIIASRWNENETAFLC